MEEVELDQARPSKDILWISVCVKKINEDRSSFGTVTKEQLNVLMMFMLYNLNNTICG